MILRVCSRSVLSTSRPIRSFCTTRTFSSFIPIMPPRRKATVPPIAGITLETASSSDIPTAAFSTSPVAEVKPSLLQALEHIPPAVAPGPPSDTSDLTPPPFSQDVNMKVEPETSQPELPTPPLTDSAEETAAPVKTKRGRKAVADKATDKPTPKKRASRASKAKAEDDEAEEAEEEVEPPKVTPKKRGKKAATPSEDGSDFNGSDDGTVASALEGLEEKKPKAKKEKKKTPKKSRIAKEEPEFDSDGNEIPKKKRKTKVYEKVIYDIPDVERKETTFRGRLGYACLNTVLRNIKPAKDSIFCSRTCRIASILEEGMELPKQLGMLNVKDLLKMIQWNEDNKIRFLRMSSEMFPFASHDKFGYSLEYADAELKEAGALAKKYGHRLTMHPGQFTQIGSPKPAVVRASVRELEYQCEIMDRMGLDQDGVMIIHMGGVYGDKPSTLARFKENYVKLGDHIKRRLVLENDEICYNVDDLLPLCQELEIPIIFDYHHDWINPSCEPPGVLIPKINEIWAKKGIRVKQHLSEPRPGAETVMERRAHADRCKALPPDLPDDVDLMIEAKDKEQAVFELYRIYGLEDVIHDNLRPPDPEPSMRTKGRKSSLKKKTKETGEVDSDGEPVELEDVEKEGDGGIGDEGLIETREVDVEMKEDVEEKPKTKTTPKRGKKAKAAAPAEETEEIEEAQESVEVPVEADVLEKDKPKRGRKKKVDLES